MTSTLPVCAGDERRALVRADPDLNGLDYLEVSGDQRRLTVYFLDKAPTYLEPGNLRITGGRRVTDIKVIGFRLCQNEDPERDDCLTIDLDRPGDFSCYRLEIVETDDRGRPTNQRHHGFDPRYWWLDLNFKVGCPTDLDCGCAPADVPSWPQPEIRYLAKDYASFRDLLLDRMALSAPGWVERHAPDLQITLLEVLAYVGDHLSYYQDAVATEAYLQTARLRTSVRRHARLVDYRMHEGCTAWTWMVIQSDSDFELAGDGLAFITSVRDRLGTAGSILTPTDLDRLPVDSYSWFEPSLPGALTVRAARSEIEIYSWQNSECCLSAGATRATLVDKVGEHGASLLELTAGDVLIVEEILGPRTGAPGDADPAHRHAVRLTAADRGTDALTGTPIVEVQWGAADALPFAVCLSAVGPPPECALLQPVSVVRGNVVLVDAGRTVVEGIGEVPTVSEQPPCADGCPDPPIQVAGPFRPHLAGRSLTYRGPVDGSGPAAWPIPADPRQALPQLQVTGDGGTWSSTFDLLASEPDDRHLVVEIDDEGTARLRFGDDILGRAPRIGYPMTAQYRVGNGPDGNIGAESLVHIVHPDKLDGATVVVRNPLPAVGGTAAESVADVRMSAPQAYRRDRQRAITAADYGELTDRDFAASVQRAAAELRWNGSWYEARVAIDARGTAQPDAALIEAVQHRLERYRRVAHDLRVVPAEAVALDIELRVCVNAHHRRSDVARALRERLGNRRRADGSLGFFYPDALTFGTTIAVSSLVAAAAGVAGVDEVTVTRLQRYQGFDDGALDDGALKLSAQQIPRLDNDPSAPENGVLRLDLGGGR
ncbi:MAG TPA: putative baseplate assembly protein [Nakamurella sp.]|nr:putative baseplate assembly protein [Nakamurella sp.]